MPGHIQNHLPAFLGAHASDVVFSPCPHIFERAAIPLARHGRFAPVGFEIRDPVVLSVFLPGHPAKAITVENGMPAAGFCFAHELSEGRLTAHRRISVRLHPRPRMLPVENNGHQVNFDCGGEFIQIGQGIGQRRIFRIYSVRIPVSLAPHRERDGHRRLGEPLGNVRPLGELRRAEGLLGCPVSINLGSGIPISVECAEHHVIRKLCLAGPARARVVSEPHHDPVLLKQRIDELRQPFGIVARHVETARRVVIGHQLRRGPFTRIVVVAPDFGRVVIVPAPGPHGHRGFNRPCQRTVCK